MCICKCASENPKFEQETKKLNRLMAERHHLEIIKRYLNGARVGISIHSPEFSLLIAVEQLYIIERRRVNKKLREAQLKEIRK